MAPLRLVLVGIIGMCLTPSITVAQQSYPAVRRMFSNQPLTGQEIENHLRGYNRGNHNHGGYGVGYSHSGGYGFGGGYGFYYGGGFMPPSYGMTNGLYPYRSIYSYPSNDDQPLPVFSRPTANPHQNPSTADGVPIFVPLAPPPGQPQTFPLASPSAVPLVDSPPAASVVKRAAPTQPASSPNVATIRILLPDPAAKIILDGQPTASLGRERTFFSPPLEPGKYTYTVIAKWSQNGVPMREVRTAVISPSETTLIDFTRSDSASATPGPTMEPSVTSAPAGVSVQGRGS